MKRGFLVFLTTITFIPYQLAAQTTHFNLGCATNSIIRAVDDDLQLIYTEISPSESYFLRQQLMRGFPKTVDNIQWM